MLDLGQRKQRDFRATEDVESFVALVWREGERLYRNLPWRNIDDAYQVLVSEVMLQQTQVIRVQKYWERFCSLFPSIDALAAADTATLLEQWQGLGYNRRALALKRTAEICSLDYKGKLPETEEHLLALPGIGRATAAGILAFAHNIPSVYIETNVRAVFIHEFFPNAESVRDSDLRPLVEVTCSQTDPRAWYYALLDYGAHLKQKQLNPSRKSAHYAKQSNFVGSRRQKRAELLRLVLSNSGITSKDLLSRLNAFEVHAGRETLDQDLFDSIIADMVKEGFFRQEGESFFS